MSAIHGMVADMHQTSARLLLLLSLLQARREWSGPGLADRLQVSARTIRRDIDRLRELGYPVQATSGPGAVYRLAAGTELPPLLFDDDQAVAVTLALQLAPTSVTGFGEAAARALTTIRQVMPPRLRRQIDALQFTSINNSWAFLGPAVDAASLSAIAAAVRDREVLRFDYAHATPEDPDGHGDEDRRARRRVEPHHLLVWSGRWYLLAWDLDLEQWQTLRVDRMALRIRTGLRFAVRSLPTDDVTEYVRRHVDRGDIPDDWPCQGEVILHAPASLVAQWAPGGAVVEEVGAECCRMIMGAWSWIGLAALYGTFAADMEVVGPPELVEACAQLARRYAAVG